MQREERKLNGKKREDKNKRDGKEKEQKEIKRKLVLFGCNVINVCMRNTYQQQEIETP